MKWAIVMEMSENGFGAYTPDAPGVGVVGSATDEVRDNLAQAQKLYLEESAAGSPSPPTAAVEYIELPARA
jgi:predicted RNase H-like HicB family nuclease